MPSGVASRSACRLSSSVSLAASLWCAGAALDGVKRSPAPQLSPRLVSVSIDSSCSLVALGVDAGRSGLASEGGDSGERMGDPPGTLPPLEEDEALSVTTSFHELATDSLVARCGCCCCSPPGDSAFFFLSNRFSNMGCTSSPPGSSSDVACARPPVRLRSAASASKMRRASSSSATPPPTAAVCGWAPRLVLLLVLLVTTTVPAVALPPSLLLPPLFLVELLLLLQLSPTPVDEVTTFRPDSGASGRGGGLSFGGLGAQGVSAARAFPATVLVTALALLLVVLPALVVVGAAAAGAWFSPEIPLSRERAPSASSWTAQGRAAVRFAPAAAATAAAASSSPSALRFLLIS